MRPKITSFLNAFFLGGCLLLASSVSMAQTSPSWSAPGPEQWAAATDKAPLPEDQAFHVEAITTNDGTLVRLTPANGYYIYQEKTAFKDPAGATLQGIWPKAEIHDDPHFGPTPIHRQQVEVSLRQSPASLHVSFQGCQDGGICYPPMTREISLSGGGSGVNPITSISSTPTQAPVAASDTNETIAEDQQWTEKLRDRQAWWVLGAFFIGGLALSMTPCVLPLLPVILGLIAPARQAGKSTLWLASLYVLSHSLVLAAAGAAGAAMGGGAGLVQQLQKPLWLIFAAVLFILLGAWQGGWIGHGMGSRFNSVVHRWMASIPQGRAWGAVALGAASALVMGPCVAPPTVGAVMFVAQEGSIALGASALFFMGLGMGMPLLLLAAGGVRLLPSSGAWMEQFTKVGAMGLFGVGVILLDRVTGQQQPLAWGLIWALASACLWIPRQFFGWLMGPAIALSVGLMWMHASQPSVINHASTGLAFETVSATELRTRLTQGKPVLVDLSAQWCTSCLTMEKTTFIDPKVGAAAVGLIALRLNLDEIEPDEQIFLKEYGLIGPPAVLFFGANGKETRRSRLVGPETPTSFVRRLQGL